MNDNRTVHQMFEDRLAQERERIANTKRKADAASKAFDAVADSLEKAGVDRAFVRAMRDPHQTVPSHEPGIDVPCLYCGFQLSLDNVRTFSLMVPSDYAARSFFYRVHRTCDEVSPGAMDGFVLDMIGRGGQ